MKKIAIVTVGELPVPTVKGGGAETLIEQILDENEIHKRFEFVVYSIDDEEAREKSKKYQLSKFVFLKKERNSLVDRIRRKCIYLTTGFHIPLSNFDYNKIIDGIKNENVDYVLIENTMVPFEKYVKVFGEKVLLHTHWDYINNTLPSIVLKKYRNAALDCGGIVTVSEYIKSRILTVPEIQSDRVKVLKNCTDIKKFNIEVSEEDRNRRREKYGIKKEDVVFVFSGRISEEKGVVELSKAFNKVQKAIDNVKLLIVGSAQTGNTIVDEYTRKVYEILDECKDKVVFTGYVNHDDMPNVYNMADVALLPSTGQDPAPLTIFEAMASGLPIITTYSGGIPEYASEKCAEFVEIDDGIVDSLVEKITKLATEDDNRRNKGCESKNRAPLFSTEKYFEDFVAILE